MQDMNKTVRAICIDDFALKKRQRYGTLMIDADSGRIIDMIESRESEEVAQWLSKFPDVKIVSRDGSITYAAAITKGLPQAIQISDRFHLLKNLIDAANKCFQGIFQGRVPIPLTSESKRREQILSLGTEEEKSRLLKTLYSEGRTVREIQSITGMTGETVKKYLNSERRYASKKSCTVRGKEHDDAVQKVQERADSVRRMHGEGNSISEICRNTGFTYATVKRYLSDSFTPMNSHYGKSREGKLQRFRDDVLQMRAEGKTYKQIYEIIKAQGYTGTQDAIRGWVTKEQRVVGDFQDKFGYTEFVEKKWIVRLLYKPLRDIPALTREQFAAVLKTYPLAKEIFKFIYRFKGILKSRDMKRLKKWIADTAVSEFEEIKAFANGLKNDFAAVLNAFLYDYNNGLAEGSVNKVKLIKRIMYGRCSFDLLKSKILISENLRFNP